MLPHFFIVPHTHWDREWYQSFQDFRRRLVRLVDRMLEVLEGDPSFTHFHFDGQTIVLEDYLEIRPENRDRLRRLIKAGRIAIGPWYVLPDEFLVSGESIIRNLQIGHRLARQFGTPMSIGYLPDQFGHIAQMPQILNLFRIDDAVVWRGVGADVDRTEFYWEAPDGTRVFTVYLPGWGYSNGARLPADAQRLRQRLETLAEEHAPFRRTPLMLVMNGTDHQEPQAELTALLAQLNREDGFEGKITSLASYIAHTRVACDCVPGVDNAAFAGAEARKPLPIHRGELRSPLRAHLLPGVTSMRGRQKQRDFDNVSLLERYAEPLASWADWLGRERDLTGFTDWAWKVAVQNHPHDSICGCSIDQVHQDMEYRFDQVEAVAHATLERGLRRVAENVLAGAVVPSLVVYNPNHGGDAIVRAEIQHSHPDQIELRDLDGRSVPLQLEVGGAEVVVDAELPAMVVRPHIAGMHNRELFGYFINAVSLTRTGSHLNAEVTVDRVLRGSLDLTGIRQGWLSHLDDPEVQSIRLLVRTPAKVTALVRASLGGFGLTPLSLTEREGGEPVAPADPNLRIDAESIENSFYRVTVNVDGTLAIRDKRLDLLLPRCNWFVDEGDRGDEYNFDALQSAAPIAEPSLSPIIAVRRSGPLAATLCIQQTYSLPAQLEADRETRSPARVEVPISTEVTLYAGLKRVDFEATIENRAADHRLRVYFETPLAARSIHSEQAFALIERSLDLEPDGNLEHTIGTVPQKTFSCIERDGLGVALLNRGIQEIEGVRSEDGTALAMTLIRSVGWLSRGDLHLRSGHAGPGLETPGGQSPGRHRFEYSLTTYAGDWMEAGVVGRAHQYAYPPTAALIDAAPMAPQPLFECDNPHIVMSAVTPSSFKDGLLMRCYNSATTPQSAELRFPSARRVKRVDLLEKEQRGNIRTGRRRWTIAFRPNEIVTLQLR